MGTPDSVPAPPAAEKVTGYMMFLWADGATEKWFKLPPEWVPDAPVPDYWNNTTTACERKDSYSKGARPGQIFEFRFTPDRVSVFYNPKKAARLVGLAPPEALLKLRALHDTFAARDALKKASGATRDVLKFLDPVRAAYHAAHGPARAQLLAQVVQYIAAH